MKYGLSEKQLNEIISILSTFTEIEDAILFGSRTIYTYKEASDVDIAIKGKKVTASLAAKLKYRFEEETYLPFFFDFVAYPTITNEALKEHIKTKGVSIYRAGWKECKLGDVAVFQRGHDLPKTEMLNGSIPVAGSNGIIGYHNKATTKGPGITLGRSGNIGTPKFYKMDFWAHNTVLYVKDFKGNDENFVFYFLHTFDFAGFNAGSAVPTLNRNHIHEIPVKIPPLPEQKAIASVLSNLDNKIDLLHRQNKTLEAMAETLFRQWFVEEADEGWEEKPLSELLTITYSKRIFYSEYVTSGIPFYRSKEIIELRNTGSTNSELYISEDRFNKIDKKFGSPKIEDILMTSVGTLGIPYRVRKGDRFYFKDGNLTWFKDFKGIPSTIIYFWLLSKIGQEELATITIGSTQEALTIEGLKNISFKLPPKENIANYELVFNSIIDKIEFNQSQIRTLEKLRDTLLPKLMSGEVRVEI